MSRVSQLELYNDKDVITQILLMKEQVETGTYKEVRVIETGGNYVFEFVNQKDEVETFTVPAKQISGVTSSQAGSTVTMRVTYNDGTYQDVSWTAGGDVTTNTAQTISAVKTFSVSPIVPDTPSGIHAAVNVTYVETTPGTNNLLHKSGNETFTGRKTSEGLINGIAGRYSPRLPFDSTRKWYKVAKFKYNASYRLKMYALHEAATDNFGMWEVIWKVSSTTYGYVTDTKAKGYPLGDMDLTTDTCVAYDTVNDTYTLYLKTLPYIYMQVVFEYIAAFGNPLFTDSTTLTTYDSVEEDPTTLSDVTLFYPVVI